MIPEPDWNKALEKARQYKKIIILGEVDTGKSTFARYLIKSILREQKSVCFIDSDIGQSSIAPPTTIAVKLYNETASLNDDEIVIDFDRIYFVGFTTPSIYPELFIQEFTNAIIFAEKLDVITLVDTTGLISGDMGKKLKLKKISIFKPDLVIAFSRAGEINHILSEITSETIILTPSKNITPRNPLKRAEYRMKKFKKYFKNAETLAVERKLLKGQSLPNDPQGAILGIYKGEECMALGVIEDIDKEKVIFFCPSIDIKIINKLKIGHLNLKMES